MDRAVSAISASALLCLFLVISRLLHVSGNAEGDALNALKTNLADPNNVLQSWDATLVNPCTWFHVTCNSDNSVTRVDLGNANLSGQLVSQLGQLPNLQYLELYSNNISGKVPNELGNLTNLVSLDLYLNNLNGPIPDTLGRLQKLRFLRLNNNSLTDKIPMSLTTITSLQVLDLSNNRLTGIIPVNGSFSLFTALSFANNLLQTPPASPPPPLPPTPSASSGNSATGAIAGGVAAGAALLFAAPAIALAYWRRRKPEDHFFDVPAEEDPEVHLGQLKRFSLRELQVATDNFSNRNILGRGGFGKVYKGRLADGSLVAVKRLKEERTQGGELQFQTEVEMISMAVHRNLLRLRGFCMTPTERLLVYPYMANGSVASCLRGSELHWDPQEALHICMIIVTQRSFIVMSKLQIYYWMRSLKQLLETLGWLNLWITRIPMLPLLYGAQLGILPLSTSPPENLQRKRMFLGMGSCFWSSSLDRGLLILLGLPTMMMSCC
ncbi:hypothetical protein CsSME_00048239 [Camellia sinensis var. sinensis]